MNGFSFQVYFDVDGALVPLVVDNMSDSSEAEFFGLRKMWKMFPAALSIECAIHMTVYMGLTAYQMFLPGVE